MLDGVGITPQAEPGAAPIPEPELPAEYQPRQAPVDPILLQQVTEEFDRGRHLLLLRVFGLMVGALLLTAAVAWWVSVSAEAPLEFGLGRIHFQLMFFFELGSVIYLARVVPKLNTRMAGIVLVAYAAFNGVSFWVFAPYLPAHAIAYGFLVTALTFAAMFVYGHVTKTDLGRLRAWAYMLLMGTLLVGMGKVLFDTPDTYIAAAVVGLAFFCNLVAYHANDIEDMYLEFDDDREGWKAAFCGALLLYLDFVNIYILMLSAINRSRTRIASED
jgi:FtsH-binding integral membrane protein